MNSIMKSIRMLRYVHSVKQHYEEHKDAKI